MALSNSQGSHTGWWILWSQCSTSCSSRRSAHRFLLHPEWWANWQGPELSGHAKQKPLQSYLKLEKGIPTHDAVSRTLGMLNSEAFQRWFEGFMEQFAKGCQEVEEVDRKTLRSSYVGRKVGQYCTWRTLGQKRSRVGPLDRCRQIPRDYGSAPVASVVDIVGQGGNCLRHALPAAIGEKMMEQGRKYVLVL